MNKEELKEFATVLNGIANGKAWEFTDHSKPEIWLEAGKGHDPLILSCQFRRQIRLKPWSLPAPPEGQQWHRTDWTEEMLEGGYRPLLLWEKYVGGDEYFCKGSNVWRVETCHCSEIVRNNDIHRRTKRPFPQPEQPDPYAEFRKAYADGKALQVYVIWRGGWVDIYAPQFDLSPDKYRIKPQRHKVLLKPEDVPPGTVFHHDSQIDGAWQVVTTGGCSDGVYIDKMYVKFSAMERYKMNRSIPLTGKWDAEAWEPCHKFEQTA